MAERTGKLRGLIRKRAKLQAKIIELSGDKAKIDQQMLKIVTSKKGRDAIFIDDLKVAVITPYVRVWDLDAIRKIIHTKKVKERALAAGIIEDEIDSAALEDAVIQTTKSVRPEVIERMMKGKVLKSKQVQKMYTLKSSKSYVRVDEVKE